MGSLCPCRDEKKSKESQIVSKNIIDGGIILYDNFGLQLIGDNILTVSKYFTEFYVTASKLSRKKKGRHSRIQLVLEKNLEGKIIEVSADIKFYSKGLFTIKLFHIDAKHDISENVNRLEEIQFFSVKVKIYIGKKGVVC